MSSKDDLKSILDSIDIQDFLEEEGITFKVTQGASGEQLNIKECPCGENAKWKVYLNGRNSLGNCFSGSCEHPTFNKYSFLKTYSGIKENREFIGYLKDIARNMGWRPKRNISKPVVINTVKLPESKPISETNRNAYLEERGFDVALSQYFHLRYCEEGTWSYHIDGRERVQKFNQRIIIPVFDIEGKLVTFQGRDVTGTSDRKYLFPECLPGTGRYLYNGFNVVGCSRVIMCEGAFDVMAVFSALDQKLGKGTGLVSTGTDAIGVMGSFGKHFSCSPSDSNDQLHDLLYLQSRGLKELTIMWDGEPNTYKKAISTSLDLSKYGLVCRVAKLPLNCDPNEVSADEIITAFYRSETISKGSSLKLMLGK